MAEDKEKAVQAAMTNLEKQYSKGVVMRGDSAPLEISAIPTGSIALDRAIGVGGIPRGRITEIVGKESSGKSTVLQHIIAEAQRMGEIAVIIDAEHSLDEKYATACGVDIGRLLICQPEFGEQALDVAESLIRSEGVGVICVDSVAALVPLSELEGEMSDQQVGAQARLLGKAMRKLAGITAKSKTALVFSNQIRVNVGQFAPHGAVPETTPGGLALKFFASVRLDIRKIEDIKDGKENVGIRSRVRVKKNKVAPPLKEAMIDILYGVGICKESGIIDVGADLGILKRTGAWYTYQDQKWQGKDAAKLFLRNNPELLAEIEKEIRSAA